MSFYYKLLAIDWGETSMDFSEFKDYYLNKINQFEAIPDDVFKKVEIGKTVLNRPFSEKLSDEELQRRVTRLITSIRGHVISALNTHILNLAKKQNVHQADDFTDKIKELTGEILCIESDYFRSSIEVTLYDYIATTYPDKASLFVYTPSDIER